MTSRSSRRPNSSGSAHDLLLRETMLLREEYRRLCRSDLLTWCIEGLAPENLTPALHHRMMIRELQMVGDGDTERLMLWLPPGSAKSTYASVLFPPWFLSRHPGQCVIGASHTQDLASTFSRKVQNVVRENSGTLGYRLARESVEDWDTSNRGAYKAVGVTGPIAGRRGDLIVIDDPVKSREDAESESYREKCWNWYNADVRPRLRPGGRIVLVMTRWHEDDLAGRLLQAQGDRWRVVKLAAVAGLNDPLGREPGEMLWSDDDYGFGGELAKQRAEFEENGAGRDWRSLYQQEPKSDGSGLFQTEKISILDVRPAGGELVRGWDLAATAQHGTRDPDWTVGLLLQREQTGRFVVLDVTRFRGGPDQVMEAICNCASQDGRRVTISLPQDPGQAGKSQVLYLTRKLAGYRVISSPETGDKATRAMPSASQVNAGNVALVKHRWNGPFLSELSGFPGTTKDDQVDALSRAFAALVSPAQRARSLRLNVIGR